MLVKLDHFSKDRGENTILLKFHHLALNSGDTQPSPMSYQSATHLNWFFRDQISQEWCPPENDAIPLHRFQITVVKMQLFQFVGVKTTPGFTLNIHGAHHPSYYKYEWTSNSVG